MKDITIIGRGLAGATLSFELISRGIPHRIIDNPTLSSSSKVAAGLVNPIVLKRLKMVHDADVFMKLIPDYYENLEHLCTSSFYTEATLHHVFASIGEINLWEEKKDLAFHSNYLNAVSKDSPAYIIAPFGLGHMHGIGWLNTTEYLSAHKRYCSQSDIVIEERSINQQEVQQLVNSETTVILCNGHLLKEWDYLPKDTFSPTRGEVMTVYSEGLPKSSILHGSIFSIPLGENTFKVGATYHWDNFQDITTTDGLSKLKTDLEKIYSGPYTVVDHQAGVRPNTNDRKPIIGRLAKNLLVFNGMGSRAALMTPYLASLFADFLVNDTAIPPTYNVERFMSK